MDQHIGLWLIIEDTALPKKGKASVGVAPQYATALGKNANCQTPVSVTLASGEVPLNAELAAVPAGQLDERYRAHGQGGRACLFAGIPHETGGRD